MRKQLLEIDISNIKSEQDEDLIKIKLGKEENVYINFSKLIAQSKYIRDKYKFPEALNAIQTEIDLVSKEMNIKSESIKYFIDLIQQEKVSIPIEHYKDIYTLSEYFKVSKSIQLLDKINQEELFNDLNFTIQILLDSKQSDNEIERKLIIKIEKFLIDRVNECIGNSKFGELDIPTIYRIIELSNKDKIN